MGADAKHESSTPAQKILSALYVLILLYTFFFCIELIGGAFKIFGTDKARELLSVTDNPIVGLLIGILATSIMQSSSSTTSIVVGMVAAGTLTVHQAVPIVMGANIGTTVTATIVAMGHIQRKKEFELAFTGAVVHDFFNLCAVTLFLPIEMFFHPIEKTATWISAALVGVEGAQFQSPLKAIVEPVVEGFIHLVKMVTDNPRILSPVLLAIALALLLFTLARMVKVMRGAMAERLAVVVDKYLFTGPARGFAIGALVTAIVQSSSVTTSLVIPLLGAGIVRLEMVYPYMLGANIGTTITALLASMVTGQPAAVTVAICHLVFNIFGTMVFLPLKIVPITLARTLGRVAKTHRWVALLFIIIVFFVIPGILILVTR